MKSKVWLFTSIYDEIFSEKYLKWVNGVHLCVSTAEIQQVVQCESQFFMSRLRKSIREDDNPMQWGAMPTCDQLPGLVTFIVIKGINCPNVGITAKSGVNIAER